MFRLLMLLLGAEVIQRRWHVLAVLGGLWTLLGAAILVDALDGDTWLNPPTFGWLLLFEGLVLLVAAIVSPPPRRGRIFRALAILLPSIVIVLETPHANLVIAILLGLVLLADGVFRVASAHVVRFRGWRWAMAGGIGEILFAIATLQPWPTGYEGTIGCNVGALLIVSGLSTLRIGLRLRRLSPGAPISLLLGAAFPLERWMRDELDDAPQAGDMVVHVWTPAGAAGVAARRPLVDRYVAAVDANGVISTGHAALELKPDLYVSHYPAQEIERSPDQFNRILRAGTENDVPGRFQPSYEEEAAGWCEATEHVRFRHFDPQRLRAFWAEYRRDETYNLTSRNCSSAVAHALDAALEGVLGRADRPWRAGAGAMLSPELWAAGVLRRRAESMAWTPGLVLDYARLIQSVVEPVSRGSVIARARRSIAGTRTAEG